MNWSCCKRDDDDVEPEDPRESNQRKAMIADATIKGLAFLVVLQLVFVGKRLDDSDAYVVTRTSWMVTFVPTWILLVCLFIVMALWIRYISDMTGDKRRNTLNVIWTLSLAFIIFSTASLYLTLENCDVLSENRLQILNLEEQHRNDTYAAPLVAWPDDEEQPAAYLADISEEYVPIPLPHSWTGCVIPLAVLFSGIVLWAFFDLLTSRTLDQNIVKTCCYKTPLAEDFEDDFT